MEAFERLQSLLVILDLMLPKFDVYEECRRIRGKDTSTAILLLTARDEDIDKIVGLELGADDYLTKLFNSCELVSRVKAILMRVNRVSPERKLQLRIGDLQLTVDEGFLHSK